MKKYKNATQQAGTQFYMNLHKKGKIVMLNMLKFKDIADYSSLIEIAPKENISGAQAYQKYMKSTIPFLKEIGSKVLFYGNANAFLIGPEEEKWDVVLLVEHQSVTKFMELANNQEYLKIAGHRTASIEDSRLLPMLGSNIYQ